MPSIIVNITETEMSCMEYAAVSPQDWASSWNIYLAYVHFQGVLLG